MNTDYYKILGVEKNADPKQIKKAYKELALRFHPDHNQDDKVAEEKFKEINEAYQVLSNPDKKQAYDMGNYSHNNASGPIYSPIEEILRGMGLGGFNFDFSRKKDPTRKMQIKHPVYISLYDAVFGCEVSVKLPSYIKCMDCSGEGGNTATCHKCSGQGITTTYLGNAQYVSTCVTCNGTGKVLTTTCKSCNREGIKKKYRAIKVKIPQNTQNQTIMRMNAEQDEICDIYLIVNVEPHSKIVRNGATLYSIESISCLDAMIGGKKIVDVIDGKVELLIPKGTQNKQQLVIENHGGMIDNKRGNHIVEVSIDVPNNLTQEQIDILSKVRDELKRK